MRKSFSTEGNEERKELTLACPRSSMSRQPDKILRLRSALCVLSDLLLKGLLVFVFLTPLRAIDLSPPIAPVPTSAETTPAATVEDPAKPLGALVGKLSALDILAPADLAGFATETIAYSQALQGAKQQVSEKPIRDALAAVDQGRKLDRKAADWDDLQSRLEKLLEKPEQQKQDQQKQDKKNDQKQDQQKGQQKQDQQKQSGDKNDQKQDQQNSQGQQGQQGQEGQQQQQGDGQSGQDGEDSQQKQDQKDGAQDQQKQSGDKNDPQQKNSDKGKETDKTSEQPIKPQKQSAFGDMQKKDKKEGENSDNQNDPSQQNGDQKSENPQQQEGSQQDQQGRQSGQSGEMQQVGGSDEKPQPIDARMVVPMQKLDQIRDKDSPAVIFQRMQAAQDAQQQQTGAAQKPKGKDW